ncbi:hypothetical protein [Streptomyces sp. NPDC001661]
MSDQLIDPSGIPHFIGDLATLDTDVTNLSTHAGEFRSAGADVHTEFQGLSAFYQAPEADQLFATTLPVKTKTDAFADDLEKVSSALSAYSTEVQPLVKKLDTLKADATAFVNSVSGDDDWRKDQDKVDHNNDLWHDVNHTVAAFQSAERAAYNKIMALIGGTALTTDDGSHAKNMYGFKAGDLDHAEETPWGSSAEREYEGLAWLGHQIKSYVWDGFIVDGVWGTITGLGTLVGTDGWAAAGQAWKHLAQLGTGLAITSTAMFGGAGVAAAYWTAPDDKLPTWLRESRTTMKETGKALVAWDTWKTNPSRAAGAVTFNAVTAIFTGGAGSAASGAGKAGAVARALSITGKAARIVDPMTYVGKAGKFAYLKVGDTFTALKNLRTGASVDLVRQADAVRSPSIPETAIPYVDNATGKVVYLTDQGHLLNADGNLVQHADQAPGEVSAADRSRLDASDGRARSPELVGAHPAANSAAETGHAAPGVAGDTRSIGHHESPSIHDGGSERPSNTATSAHPPGIGNSGGRSHDAPEPRPSGGREHDPGHQPTPEEQQKTVEDQVKKANDDPAWRNDHYRIDGERRSIYGKDENGNFLPQIKMGPDGKWIAASDIPHGPPEGYRLQPAKAGPDSVPPHAEKELSEAARVHHAHHELNVAEKEFKADASPEKKRALEAAQDAFGDRPRNTRIGEALGTKASELHAIPKLFPDAEEIVLPRTSNGANEFDNVYRLKRADGEFLLVENKAPDGTLQWRMGTGPHAHMKVKQGTLEYAETIVKLMEQRGGKEADVAAELTRAIRRKKLQYVLVQANPHTGTYNGATLSYFKLFEES